MSICPSVFLCLFVFMVIWIIKNVVGCSSMFDILPVLSVSWVKIQLKGFIRRQYLLSVLYLAKVYRKNIVLKSALAKLLSDTKMDMLTRMKLFIKGYPRFVFIIRLYRSRYDKDLFFFNVIIDICAEINQYHHITPFVV